MYFSLACLCGRVKCKTQSHDGGRCGTRMKQVFTEEQSQLLARALTAEKRVRELEASLEAFVKEIENVKKPEEELLDLRRQVDACRARFSWLVSHCSYRV